MPSAGMPVRRKPRRIGQPRAWWFKILKRYTEPKGRFLSRVQYAALAGPLFHGIIGAIACVGKTSRILGCVWKRRRREGKRRKGGLLFKNPKIAGTGSPSGSGDLKVPKSSPRLPRAFQVGTLWTYQGRSFAPFSTHSSSAGSACFVSKKIWKNSRGGCGAGNGSSETVRRIDSLLDGCKPNDPPLSRNLKIRKQAQLSVGDEMDDRSEQPQAWKLDDTSFGTTFWVCDAKHWPYPHIPQRLDLSPFSPPCTRSLFGPWSQS